MYFGSIFYPVLWQVDQTIPLCDTTVNQGLQIFTTEAAALGREGAHVSDESSV
jgi:hypothetical protein